MNSPLFRSIFVCLLTILASATSHATVGSETLKPVEVDVLENLWNWRETLEVSPNAESDHKKSQIKAIENCLDVLGMGNVKLNSRAFKRLQYLPQHELETRQALHKLWESVSRNDGNPRGEILGKGVRTCLKDFNTLSEKDRQDSLRTFGVINQ